MKILSNKKYGELVDRIKNEVIKEKDEEIKHLDNYNYELLEDKNKYCDLYRKLKETNDEHQIMNGLLQKENDNLKAQIKRVNGQKGILTRKVNSLTKELEETKKQLEESMSDKFRVKKLPSGRKPKGQTTKIKSNSKESNAIKLVKERL
jgi:uncharacterized protein YpuA (DUF1002 family)